MTKLDEIDRKILRILQEDASQTILAIAEQCGLSHAPCWRRINLLKESGVIEKQVVVLNRKLLGYDLTAFVRVKLSENAADRLLEFEAAAMRLTEVQELQLISTENAYRMRVVVPTFADYEYFFRERLGRLPHFQDANSSFVVSEPKYSFALPL